MMKGWETDVAEAGIAGCTVLTSGEEVSKPGYTRGR